ncbi:MAG: hypothetical protein CMN78_06095 [Spirochaetales bacterium]|nr:hypothetical protein [Spirochaetales bacterium]
MHHNLRPISDISIYIHVPFCPKKCRYCDFFSLAKQTSTTKRQIIGETLHQLVYFLIELGNPRVATVYIGGGTPNELELPLARYFFEAVYQMLRSYAKSDDIKEWTVELNPELITAEYLSLMAEYGVTRLSVGAQTFSERQYDIIGRVGGTKQNRVALDCIRREWKRDLNIDIITALPDQRLSEAKLDIDSATHYQPDHISLYTLTIEDNTPLRDDARLGKIQPLDQQLAESIWLRQMEKLETMGYERYEVSNFAQQGKQCLHNLAYWKMSPYLGCGPASVSTLPSTTGPHRLTTNRSFETFLTGRTSFWGILDEAISARSFLIEHVMMGIRLSKGIDIRRLKRIFGIDLLKIVPRVFDEWFRKELLCVETDRVWLSQNGLNLLDRFLQEFIEELGETIPERLVWPVLSR